MMNSFKQMIILSGILIGTVGGYASANCDTSSLSGQYAFKAQGAVIGVFDPSGTLHSFNSPQLVTSVGQFIFDGNGSFTRSDFAVNNGVVAGSPTPLTDTGFRTGQSGNYIVDADCTGVISLSIPGGTEIDFATALIDFGQSAVGTVKREHIPGLPPAAVPAGTTCDAGSGCDVGVNLLIELTRNTARRR
jgi:hypothetical protein